MLPRVVGVPAAALVVLVAAPPIVLHPSTGSSTPTTIAVPPPGESVVVKVGGKTINVATTKEAQAKPTATLKIGLSHDRHTYFLSLRAAGAPPKAAQTLADADGTHVAVVRRAPQSKCPTKPVYDTNTGKKPWCLSVTGLPAAHEVSGTVDGGTTLMLTLDHRHELKSWPIFWVILGLFAPLGAGVVMGVLRRRPALYPVNRVIRRNAGNEDTKIVDLKEWAEAKTTAGTAPGDLRVLAEQAVRGAPEIRSARRELRKALGTTTLSQELPYVEAAAEAGEDRPLHVSDILDEDDKPVIPVAEQFLAKLDPLETAQRALSDLHAVLVTIENGHRFEAQEAWERATRTFVAVSEPDDVPALRDLIIGAAAAIAAAEREPAVESVEQGGEEHIVGTDRTQVRAERSTLELLFGDLTGQTPSPLALKGKELLRDEVAMSLLTALVFFAALAFAAWTVLQDGYYANPTFGTWGDYFTTFSAALATGAAATVLTLISDWRPTPSTTPA